MCDNPRDESGVRAPVGGGNSYKSYVTDSGAVCDDCSFELPNGNQVHSIVSHLRPTAIVSSASGPGSHSHVSPLHRLGPGVCLVAVSQRGVP